MKSGSTLVEVLVAFGIFVSGLILVSAGFSRHLTILEMLGNSIAAYHVADQQILQEQLRREHKLQLPDEVTEEVFVPQLSILPLKLDTEPVKDHVLDQATCEVSWSFRNQTRSIKLTTGFQREPVAAE